MSTELLRTPLFEIHRETGARLVPFAGWEMPVQYAGVLPEVRAVREGCGLFDVSHMGQFQIEGEGASAWLNTMVSADWSEIAPGRAAYALLLNKDGGVIDDIMGYRLGAESWLLVVNASRAAVDEKHLRAHLPVGITLENGYGNAALLAIQGPKSQEVLQKLIGENLDAVAWRDVILMGGSTDAVLVRGGYTGCDGFEIMFNADDAAPLWKALVNAGATPCGLGARDVLRLEAGLPLYGHELRENWTPFQSGCAWAVKLEKTEFIGRDALLAQNDFATPTSSPNDFVQNDSSQSAITPNSISQNGASSGDSSSSTESPTGFSMQNSLQNGSSPSEISPNEISQNGASHHAISRNGSAPDESSSHDLASGKSAQNGGMHDDSAQISAAESAFVINEEVSVPSHDLSQSAAEVSDFARTIKALRMSGKAIPREGYRVLDAAGARLGEITSGTMSPMLGVGIALAFLPRVLRVGAEVFVEIRGVSHSAQIVKTPFVPRGRK